jgi:hypothetical protein
MSTAPIHSKTYLDICTEELANSNKIANKHDLHATANKVGGYALIGFYIIAAGAAVAATGLYAPVFVPVAIITIICFKDPVWQVAKGRFDQSAVHTHSAIKLRAIKKIHTTVQTSTLTNSKRLMPLVAHYNYWDRVQNECQKQVKAKLKEAKVKKQNKVSLYLDAASFRQQALCAKVSKAFIRAVIHHPEYKGTADNLCALRDFSVPAKGSLLTASLEHNDWARHALFRDFEDEQADDFAVFRNPDIEPLTFDFVKNATTREISESFIQAIEQEEAAI